MIAGLWEQEKAKRGGGWMVKASSCSVHVIRLPLQENGESKIVARDE